MNDDDSTAFFRWLDEDLELIPPNAPPLRGEAARKIFRDLFAGFEVEKAEFFDEEWSGGTEVAVGRYSYRLRLKPRNKGEPAEESGSGVHVWRRAKDGQWRLAQDIWSVPASPRKAL